MAAERRGRPPASDSAVTRARIVSVAQELFAERGYRGVSMDQLAKAAGVNVRAIYHYVPSKRALFEAAAATAFEKYGAEVVERVLAHDDLAGRLHGFVDVYRVLYERDRHLLAFLSVMLTEAINDSRAAAAAAPGTGRNAPKPTGPALAFADPILAMNRAIVDQARERRELAASVTPEAAMTLLQSIGMGVGLSALDDEASFLPMLDALDLLIDGVLVLPGRAGRARSPRSARPRPAR